MSVCLAQRDFTAEFHITRPLAPLSCTLPPGHRTPEAPVSTFVTVQERHDIIPKILTIRFEFMGHYLVFGVGAVITCKTLHVYAFLTT